MPIICNKDRKVLYLEAFWINILSEMLGNFPNEFDE